MSRTRVDEAIEATRRINDRTYPVNGTVDLSVSVVRYSTKNEVEILYRGTVVWSSNAEDPLVYADAIEKRVLDRIREEARGVLELLGP